MELVCTDFLTLESYSKGGIQNILMIVDHFTRYAKACAQFHPEIKLVKQR